MDVSGHKIPFMIGAYYGSKKLNDINTFFK